LHSRPGYAFLAMLLLSLNAPAYCGLKTSVALSEDECCATSTTAGENAWSRVSGCVTLQENIPLPIF
jgi:hypothetical protein